MYVINITDLNATNDFDNITDYSININNCTITENLFVSIIPTLILTITCGLSVYV